MLSLVKGKKDLGLRIVFEIAEVTGDGSGNCGGILLIKCGVQKAKM